MNKVSDIWLSSPAKCNSFNDYLIYYGIKWTFAIKIKFSLEWHSVESFKKKKSKTLIFYECPKAGGGEGWHLMALKK